MLKVGVTGGIGSGKTTICKIFEQIGIPVYYSDSRAKELMSENQELVLKIKSLFGENVYHNSTLNKKFIAEIVFKDKIMLNRLNEVVHPAVFQDAANWFNQQLNVPYAIYESALLLEKGKNSFVDKSILIIAPLELRIERIMQRDQADFTAVYARIQSQTTDDEKLQYVDFIVNNNNEDSLIGQILNIHNQLVR